MDLSYFQKKHTIKAFNCLDSNKKCDVLIIGGGMAGLLSKYELDHLGYHTILVEKDTIGSHSSGKLTGKLAFILDNMARVSDELTRHRYLKACIEGYQEMIRLINRENIDCDLHVEPHYFIGNYMDIHDFYKKLKHLDLVKTELEKKDAFYVYPQALIDPVLLMQGLVKSFEEVYEHTKANTYKKVNNEYIVRCNEYDIYCKEMVVATRIPIFHNYNLFRMDQIRYPMYLTPMHGKAAYYDITTKKSRRYIDQYNIYVNEPMEHMMKWYNQDTYTYDGLPFIGRMHDYYSLFGFNGWGLVQSMVGARVLGDLISNKHNEYEALFSPNRTSLKGSMMGLIATTGRSIKHYLNFDSTPFCTHLGCKTIYDKENEYYYCPCHGSIYDKQGHVVEGPAKKNLK